MPNHVLRDRIWHSKKLAKCSLTASLAYPWIYLVCDDWGRFEYDPRAIWKQVFLKRDDVTAEDVSGWLEEYEKAGLLVRYHMYDDLAYWTGFSGRELKKRRESQHPDPKQFRGIEIETGESVRTFALPSVHSGAERSGADHNIPPAAPPEVIVGAVKYNVSGWSREACEDWNSRFGKGSVNGGEVGRFLKPLVEANTWAEVRPVWVYYLTWKEPDFAKPADFKAKFGEWQSRYRQASPIKPTSGSLKAALRAAGADGND